MKTLNTIAAAGIIAMLTGTAAQAADSVTYAAGPDLSMALYDDYGFDWGGFYAGIYGAGIIDMGDSDADIDGSVSYGIGINAGYNMAFSFYLVGAEVAIQASNLFGEEIEYDGQILGRGGIVVTDEILAYGAVGFGSELGAEDAENHLLLGGGLEVALTDALSVRGQYLYGQPVSDSATTEHQVTVGAAFHF